MPYINSFQFGEITIDHKKYHQVLIVGDKAEERDCEKLERLYNTSHQIGDWEIEELLKNNPELIMIGTGVDGVLEVNPELIEKAKLAGIELIADLTPKIVEMYNQKVKAGQRVNALIHTTC